MVPGLGGTGLRGRGHGEGELLYPYGSAVYCFERLVVLYYYCTVLQAGK